MIQRIFHINACLVGKYSSIKVAWKDILEYILVNALLCVKCLINHLIKTAILLPTWQHTQTTLHISALFVKEDLNINMLWLCIWVFILVKASAMFVTNGSIRNTPLSLTWKLILRRSLILAQFVENPLNINIIWLNIWEFLLGNALMYMQSVKKRSLTEVTNRGFSETAD